MTAPVNLSEILIPLLPDIGLLILLLVVLLIDLFTRPLRRRVTGFVAGFGIIIVLIINLVVGLNDVPNQSSNIFVREMLSHTIAQFSRFGSFEKMDHVANQHVSVWCHIHSLLLCSVTEEVGHGHRDFDS